MNNTPFTQQLQAYLEQELEPMLAMLQQMVGINSFTGNPAGVEGVGQFTAAQFAPLGFAAQWVPNANPDFGQHLILTRPGRTSRTLGLVSHLDTVFPPDEEIANDFRWQEQTHGDQTRIYGPGTVDIKGGTALIHLMLRALAALQPDLFEELTWVLLFNASEEAFSGDFAAVGRAYLPAEETIAALVFEGGNWAQGNPKLVVARKGMARHKVTVEGRAAHAGVAHEQGANAIIQLAEIAQKVAALTDYGRSLTFNVGVIQGGTVVNRVPHAAEMLTECRAFDPQVFAEALISMQSLERYSTVTSPADGYPCRTHVQRLLAHAPWPRNEGTERLLAVWQRVGRSLGYEVLPEERGGVSDANLLWQHVPVLDGLGPWGDNDHCSERSDDGSKEPEYVIRESFVPKALLNILAILELEAVSRKL
ncbi:MAG: M20/M25/M40 family metallo-hydrolase [Chloroflexi bacterium]|nr:M20/M25/M40 family metallo-hydrolase [Chloroflexota bacterium]